MRSQTFLSSVISHYNAWCVILAGEVLNYFFIGYGSIGVITFLYAILTFAILPAIRSRTTGDVRRSLDDLGVDQNSDAVDLDEVSKGI